jgi:hypothetical protein
MKMLCPSGPAKWRTFRQWIADGRLLALVLTIFFMPEILKSQMVPTRAFIKQHAVPVPYLAGPDENVYKALSKFSIILIGEIHGTAEPAEFAEGLVKSFVKHNREVIFGIEIPADQMDAFKSDRTIYALAKTRFFNSPNADGRRSEAWANLLLHLGDTKVQLFYFDLAGDEWKDAADREGIMFEKINALLKQHPKAVFIGLCGNFHSSLQAYKGFKPMADFFTNSPISAVKDPSKIACISNMFESGSAYCTLSADSAGPKVVDVPIVESTYNDATTYEHYLLLYNTGQYNGVIFTRKITPSFGWNEADK